MNRFLKIIFISIFCFYLNIQSDDKLDKSNIPISGQVWYVVSPRGINLRSEASETSQVLAKLPNRTQLKILEQSETSSKIKFLDGRVSDKKVAMYLEGAWVKVKYKDQEGFVFNRLISKYPPIQKKEFKEGYDITPYLVRIFSLGKPKQKQFEIKEGGETYLRKIFSYESKDKIQFIVELENQAWGDAKLILPNWELEDAIVFFYSILSPLDRSAMDFEYTKEKSASYSLDRVPNTIEFQKDRKGVIIKWNWGPD
ncbi:MAG: SH3 domain-containing protein [Leptospiraceae bacterium]|nr:SH3 domain-containing protein [Leptospiraceae bacterium]